MGETELSGLLADQAALFGVLNRLHNLGLTLLIVARTDQFSDQKELLYKNITKIALKGIALAMGVAVIVMSALKTLDIEAGISMLGMGLAALALAGFQE